LQALGIPLPVTEAILNHKGGSISGVAAIYHRHDYAREKAQALTAWSERLQSLLAGQPAPSNVFELAGRRA
jgi:hypothetical protein